MLVLLAIGLLAGLVTAISPCVLPVLPILLAGGASGRRPFRIAAGLVGSFVAFTLFGSWLLDRAGLPQDLLRNVALALLFLAAATLLVPPVALAVERPLARLSSLRLPLPSRERQRGGGGFVLGISLGLVFVPCAGPVLAAVTAVAATNRVGWRVALLAAAYALGAAIPMVAIAFGGRGLAGRLRAHAAGVRVASGLLIGVVAAGIAAGVDTRFQTALPGYTAALQRHADETPSAERRLAGLTGTRLRQPSRASGGSLPTYGRAPAFEPDGRWFNSRPLTLRELRGKVVLVDFWTYSCINCLRTLPHLKAWYAAYRRDGFVVVGVHTPEFAFEHVAANVAAAIRRLGIRYPVFQDNRYRTWTAYANEFWPAEYLVDKDGYIRHVEFGEGSYADTERDIRTLLGLSGGPVTHVPNLTPTETTTPESYLGWKRLERYAGSPIVRGRAASYTLPGALPEDELAYGGRWTVRAQRIVAGAGAAVRLHFHARDVYVVLGGRGRVRVSVNGRPSGSIDVDAYRLYTVRSSTTLDDALLELRFTPGVLAYSFTFG